MHFLTYRHWLAVLIISACSSPNAAPHSVVDAQLDASRPDTQTSTQIDAAFSDVLIEDETGTENAREVIFCYNGATTRTQSSNLPFTDICDSLGPTVVRDCVDGPCFSTFETFVADADTTLYARLFAELDVNHDNILSGADGAVRLVLLGYSWGAVTAVHIADALAADPRVSSRKKAVDLLVALDPFQVPIATLDVPGTVRNFRELRHSITPSFDCSEGAPLGPYRGWTPRCRISSDCSDYDFSLSPNVEFPTAHGGSMSGREIGHCEVPLVSYDLVRAMVLKLPLATAPLIHAVDIIP